MQFGAPIVSGLWDQTHSFVSSKTEIKPEVILYFGYNLIFRQSAVASTDHLIGYSQTPIRRGFSVKFLKLVAFQKIAKM